MGKKIDYSYLFTAFVLLVALLLKSRFIFLTNWWFVILMIVFICSIIAFRFILRKKNWFFWSAASTLISFIIVLLSLWYYSEHISNNSDVYILPIDNTRHTRWGPYMDFHFEGKTISKRLRTYRNFESIHSDYAIRLEVVEINRTALYVKKMTYVRRDNCNKSLYLNK